VRDRIRNSLILPPDFQPIQPSWAEGALVYHIYPRSFQDSNADGVGDLLGVIKRMDYLKELGVNAIWLSPFYPSPMADFGYDVADYCNVDPMFGTLDDFKQLMAEADRRDIRVMIDLVSNHTSDEHIWFKESRKSRDHTTNPFNDWYIWRDSVAPAGSDTQQPPNNWRNALTGGPAWEWDDTRQQYYLHSFDIHQPDLNWSNPTVRAAIKQAMRFWLDLGVDGFRVDAVYWMAKEPLMSDDPGNPSFVEGEDLPYHALRHDNSRGWPAVYAYLSEMADVLHEEQYKDKQRFMVTEAYPEGHNPLVEYLNFYVGMDPKVAAPFNFEGLTMPWDASTWRKFLRAFHHALNQIDPHCVASYAFGNHDQPRIATRIGEAAARSASVLLLTLPGMVFLYYGDEIGMKNVVIPKDMVQDPAAKGDVIRGDLQPQGRDPERTPMQWTAAKNGGFSDAASTWLPLAPDYEQCNVEAQLADPDSLLNLYKKLGTMRSQSDSLKHGQLKVLEVDSPYVLGYSREHTDSDVQAYVVLVNFSGEPVTCSLGAPLGRRLLSSLSPSAGSADGAELQPDLAPSEAVTESGSGSAGEGSVRLESHEAVIYAAV